MTEEDAEGSTKRQRCISEIVAAYVTNNRVPRSDLSALIATVADAVDAIAGRQSLVVPEPVTKPTEAEIKKSVQRDRLISFIDGKPYKALRRHLRYNGHTPQSYRARYGLPVDYPMVAPSYGERRSEISRQIGLRQRSSAERKTLQ